MAFLDLLIHTVSIAPYQAGSTDRYGNAADGYGTGVDSVARVQQVSTTEDLSNQDQRGTRFRVFLPADTVVSALSRVTWNGRTLQVEGEPKVVNGATGPHHIECMTREVLG